MEGSKLKKGQVLVAEPALTGDLSFSRAVILLAEHNEEGSVGFILNKPLEFTLNELVEDIKLPFPVYNGGPVEQDNIYFIHSVPMLIPGSIEISDGIFWGGNFKALLTAIEKDKIAKEDIRFFLGYTGWSQNQLNGEIKSKSWISLENPNLKNLVKENSAFLWKKRIEALGGSYKIWSNTPENPNLN